MAQSRDGVLALASATRRGVERFKKRFILVQQKTAIEWLGTQLPLLLLRKFFYKSIL